MKRRTFVAGGVGLGAAMAGCLGDSDSAGGEPSDDGGNDHADGEGDGGDERDDEDGDDVPTDDSNDEPSDDGDDNDDSPGESEDAGYTVAFENDPVEDVGEFATLRVEVVDPHVEAESPAAFEVTLSDTPDGTITVSSGAPSPFGVLRAEPDDGSESITLWNDAYDESRHVETDGKHVELVQEVGLYEEFDGGEPVTRRFEIHGETPNLGAGSYESSVACGIEPEGTDETEWLEIEFDFAIEDGVQSVGDDGSIGEADDSGYTVRLEDDPIEDVGEFVTLQVELVDSHVEPESPAAFLTTLTNDTDRELAIVSGAPSPFGVLRADPDDDGESITLWNDAYEETGHVRTDGKDVGDIEDVELVEEFETGATITQTFEIHEETPNLGAGTYKTVLSCRIESEEPDEMEGFEAPLLLTVEEGTDGPNGEDDSGNGDGIPEEPRVDDPPYEIEEPEPSDDHDEDDWNEHYLGEEMSGEPSIEFETLEGVRFDTLALSIDDDDGDQYALDLIESRAGLEERFDLDGMEREDRERVEAVDFDEQVIVVAESGFGSGSVRHRWKRVEDREEEVHLHGYYTQPYIQTDDYGPRQSALTIEYPDNGVELARASLTVSAERRVHFDSTEGVVTVDPE